MKIVSFPENFSQKLLSKYEELLNQGMVAEGPYYQEETGPFIKNKRSVPVGSGGSAIFALLAYQKHVLGKTHVIIQSNTMRALYTIPKLLGMEVIVCDSSIDPGFLSMDKTKLEEMILQLKECNLLEKTVTVYSVIGGFLSSSYFDIEKIHIDNKIPLIIDMAHGHYLNSIIETSYADLAFSFYATKILPSGEGGLITCINDDTIKWIRRFLAYDRFHYELKVGLNLRASELTAFFIYLLLNDYSLKLYFRDYRVAVADLYRQTCLYNRIAFLDQHTAKDFNGYKFIVFDDYEKVKSMNTILSKYSPTSPVFAVHVESGEPLLPHWCPPTYPSLYKEMF
jgi:dTDP-4-amino-4,6-dideoxygalactose transaminase